MPKKTPNDLGRRTPGEELWLSRKAAGLTSYEAAARAGIGRNAYREAERDERPAPGPLKTGFRRVSRPPLALLLKLARRRSGAGLEKAARAVRLSRVGFLAAEAAGDDRIVALWEKRGFRFPEKKSVN